MNLEIRFLGVSAGSLLTERVIEIFEERLGKQVRKVESVTLEIGTSLTSLHDGVANGSSKFILKDGRSFKVQTDNSKLLVLVEATLAQLEIRLDSHADCPSPLVIHDPLRHRHDEILSI